MAADQPVVAEFGSWSSPFTADSLVTGAVRLAGVQVAPDGRVLWLEARPEHGRTVLVVDGADASPAPLSIRSRVHEYGGGAYAVAGDTVYVSNFTDQGLYRLRPGAEAALFHQVDGAALRRRPVDAERHRLMLVREDHRGGGRRHPASRSTPWSR